MECMLRRLILLCILAVLSARLSSAQTQTCPPSCTMPAGASVSVLFDPQLPRTETAYRLYINGVKVGADIPAVTGSVTIPGVVLPASGTADVKVSSLNAGGETFSDTVRIALAIPPPPAPGKPLNLRVVLVVTVAANGQVQVSVVSAEPVKPPRSRR